jgi:hypothetical protein
MQPNNSQPGVPGQPGRPQEEWPPRHGPVPDWQQGLGVNNGPQAAPGSAQIPQPMPGQQSMPGPGVLPGGPVGTAPGPQGYQNLQAPPAQVPAPQPPYSQQPPPLSPTGAPGPSTGNRMKRLFFVVIAVAVAAGIGLVTVLLMNQGNKDNGDANKAAEKSASLNTDKKATDLSTLNGVNFGLPADLSAFKGDSSPVSSYHVYLTQDSTDDKACSLEFGVLGADQLPGADLNGIVEPQIDSLRKAGATVEGPNSGAALILKDAADEKTTYSMPTVNYEFSKDNKHVTVHYSLVILKDGSRAVISRQCANAAGQADASLLQKIEESAKQITVNKQ